ncbi:MAG TPA: hypothetical protein VKF32_04045 [Thermoanaerobaculia bacterium]|nr:hypothetical protein [Thermoanaerobaculia bacterium]
MRTAKTLVVSSLLATAFGCGSATPSTGSRVITVALVDTDGERPSLEAFVPRFITEITERASVRLLDARTAGARTLALASDPAGSAASAFRKQWPADTHLLIGVLPCHPVESRFIVHVPSTGMDPVPRDEEKITEAIECAANLTLTDARDGHLIGSFVVTGAAAGRVDARPERDGTVEIRNGTGSRSGGVPQAPVSDHAERIAFQKAARVAARRVAEAVRR